MPRAEAACVVPPLQPFVFGDVQYRVAGNRPQTVRTGAEIGAIRELRTPCVDTVSCDGGGRCEPYPPPQPPYSVKLPIRRLVGIRPEVAVAVRRKWRAEDPPYLLAVALDVCTGTRSNAALVRCLRQASHSL